jgi:hypothetical protein
VPARTRERLVSALIPHLGIGIELAVSLLNEAAAIAAETDSAANQFGAYDRARTTSRAAYFRSCACGCPSQTCRISG